MHMQGERDYRELKGQTGPLVYPAGFVYIFAFLHEVTGGGNIAAGQAAFAVIYMLTQAVVLWLYVKAQVCAAGNLHFSLTPLPPFQPGAACSAAVCLVWQHPTYPRADFCTHESGLIPDYRGPLTSIMGARQGHHLRHRHTCFCCSASNLVIGKCVMTRFHTLRCTGGASMGIATSGAFKADALHLHSQAVQ